MDIIQDFFIKPIMSPEIQGYNIINTTVYIILLIIACAIIYKVLYKKINFEKEFFVAMIPYVLFGVSMRVIMHQIEIQSLIITGIQKTANPLELGFWFFTPGIWVLTFLLVIIGLLLGNVTKKINLKIVLGFGIIACIIPLLVNLSRINNIIPFVITIIAIIVVSYGVCYLVNKFTKYKILSNKMNFFIVLGQGIDGIASIIAITFFGFSEQHVLSNIIIGIHPALFALIKLCLAVLICWSLDDYLKENPKRSNLIGFVKVILAILGFATGLASLLKLGLI